MRSLIWQLSRLMLVQAVINVVGCLVIVTVLGWPTSGFVIVVGFFAALSRKGFRRFTTLGSAGWAGIRDFRRAKMLDGPGMILGRFPGSGPDVGGAVRGIFERELGAKEAVVGAFPSAEKRAGPLVRMPPSACHVCVVAPTSAGKGVSIVVPLLLTCPDAMAVLDVKGENFSITAAHRARAFGHRCVFLAPFAAGADGMNVLDLIDGSSPRALDECAALAKAIVVRGAETDAHWNDSCEAVLTATLALVAVKGSREAGTRSLLEVAKLVSTPQMFDSAVAMMVESPAFDGILARMGGALGHFEGKEKASVMTTTNRHLRFLNSVEVSASVRASSFDPAALLSGRLTVYLCLPPEHLKTQAPLMRLWITCLLNVVVRGGLSKDRMVRFLLDEAASLSRLEILDDALDKLRGYGVRLILIYQALSQIKKCFPDGQDQTVLANSSLVAFGTADLETAKGLSERIGDETVVVESGGSSGGTSFQRPSGPGHGSMTTSSNTSSNWGQQARRLLKPEEILSMDGREALFFTPGVPPGIVRLVRYFEEPCLTSRPGRLSRLSRACLYLAGSALALFLTSFVLVGLLVALHLRDAPPDPPQVFAPAVAPVRPFVAPQNRFRQQRR